MSTSINSPKTVEQLQADYQVKREAARLYREAKGIREYPSDADPEYMRLLIERDTAYVEFKKEELPESTFNRLIAPVYDFKLRRYNLLLKSLTGGII